MTQWTLSLHSAPESGLPSVDVRVQARPEATVADLARAFGRHVAPDVATLHLVPTEGSHPWPADRLVAECGLRTGDVLDVVSAPAAWLTRASSTARSRAVLRVTAGPDRGRRVHVRTGALTLGRGSGCTLQLTDPLVSQRHARIVLDTRPTVYDEGSANGTRIAGERLVSAREIDWGGQVQLGQSTVVVDRGEVPADEPAVSVFRSPRFGEPLAEAVLDFPSPPSRQRPSPLPWAMLMLPMVMGLALFARARTAYAVIYMLAWPVAGYLGWRQQRRAAEKQFQEDRREWRTDVDQLLADLDAAAGRQREQLHDDHPDPETVRTRALARDPYLWARSETRRDFLLARVGVGTVPALLRGAIKDGGDRAERRTAAAEIAARDNLADLPVLVDLAAHPLVAVVGEPDAVDALVRSLLLRVAFDHSPTDVSVAGCLGRARAHHETWLRWLPHATTRVGGEPPVALGPRAGAALLEHLVTEDGGRGHTICLVDEDAGIPRRTVEAVAAAGAERGLHVVWLGRSTTEVPAATALLVDLDAGRVALGDRAGVADLLTPDAVTLDQAWRGARSMTAYVDEAAVLPASTALPALVRLPEVCGDLDRGGSAGALDDPEAVRRRWDRSSGLRAQVGAGVDGVVTLDLREDGPHGLVAGTTGSGKSELLQALICSLALNNPPSRISFLLVDYKGGAAFRECADLPHTVGYITDLTPALVSRALTSLGAEIAAREHLLGEHQVKDLVQLERERPDLAPPSLLICVDEFAALTTEVPEFVDGMVNLAQRGRSLGMHVLLATQRPAGVVTGSIRANTDLRIALRVSSADDSRDVIDSPEAARISRRTPGRAWIRRTGHGTAELVQSAWTGARQPLEGAADAVSVTAFTAEGRPDQGLPGSETRLDPRTDLVRCVASIRAAFAASGALAPPRPWLPALPAELLLDPDQEVEAAASRPSGHVALGRLDDPARQVQPALVVDFTAVGHLLVHGASGSGKTELLRTAALAASIGDAHGPGGIAPYVYGLDYGGGGLTAVAGLPMVTSVIPESQPGRVLRLIRLLRRTVADRTQVLAAQGCTDLADLAAAGHSSPRVYVLVDNLPALVDSLETTGGVAREHLELLQNVLQNGRRVGIHVLATVPGRTGVPTALAATFGRRIVLRMNVADDYAMLGVPAGVLDADTPPGSGLIGRALVQIATTGGAGTPVQARHIAAVGVRLEPLVGDRAEARVPAMPARLDPDQLPDPAGSVVPLAVDADAVVVVDADLRAGPLLVAGRDASVRRGVLDGIVALARRSDPAAYVVDDPDLGRAASEVEDWLARHPGEPAGPEGSGSWLLLVVADGQGWDTVAGADNELRSARESLLGTLRTSGRRLGVLVAADSTHARQRGLVDGFVTTARAARRGFLLEPEWSDGEVLGVPVPTKTVEPLAGPGRGLWCEGGTARVVQAIGAAR